MKNSSHIIIQNNVEAHAFDLEKKSNLFQIKYMMVIDPLMQCLYMKDFVCVDPLFT